MGICILDFRSVIVKGEGPETLGQVLLDLAQVGIKLLMNMMIVKVATDRFHYLISSPCTEYDDLLNRYSS